MRECQYCDATAEYEASLPEHIDIVFDGPPGPEAGRFVEVENDKRHSIGGFGEWVQRDDGYWVLRINPRRPMENAAAEKRSETTQTAWSANQSNGFAPEDLAFLREKGFVQTADEIERMQAALDAVPKILRDMRACGSWDTATLNRAIENVEHAFR